MRSREPSSRLKAMSTLSPGVTCISEARTTAARREDEKNATVGNSPVVHRVARPPSYVASRTGVASFCIAFSCELGSETGGTRPGFWFSLLLSLYCGMGGTKRISATIGDEFSNESRGNRLTVAHAWLTLHTAIKPAPVPTAKCRPASSTVRAVIVDATDVEVPAIQSNTSAAFIAMCFLVCEFHTKISLCKPTETTVCPSLLAAISSTSLANALGRVEKDIWDRKLFSSSCARE